MDMDNIVTLTDEFGNDVYFEYLDLITFDNSDYVILLPIDSNDGEVVILQQDDSEEEARYVGVENDDILTTVFEIFKEKWNAEFDFEY